jgi:hypothetical protein
MLFLPSTEQAEGDLRLYAEICYYVPFIKNGIENQIHIGTAPLPYEERCGILHTVGSVLLKWWPGLSSQLGTTPICLLFVYFYYYKSKIKLFL